jgi:ABC-type branched-subunit amino acid transport system ATPase component
VVSPGWVALAGPVLGEKLRWPAGQLSGGQQQVLSLVHAYLTSPLLVLVDGAWPRSPRHA